MKTEQQKSNFIKHNVRRMCGLIAIPFLYARYSIIIFIVITAIYWNEHWTEMLFAMWGIYALFFVFVMGNCGVMKYWTLLWQKIFNVKYEIKGQWTSPMMHSHSVWSHPILSVNGKEYNLSIAVMGGNLYNEDDNIRRKAIVYSALQ